jgi:hypothetical protein
MRVDLEANRTWSAAPLSTRLVDVLRPRSSPMGRGIRSSPTLRGCPRAVTRRSSPSCLTTNKPFSEWPDVFPHAACVVTLVDRLIHRCEVKM